MPIRRTWKRKKACLSVVVFSILLISLSRRFSTVFRIIESSKVEDNVVAFTHNQQQQQQRQEIVRTSNRTHRGNNITNETIKILFVHIGKAGGETIKNVLPMGCQVKRNAQRRKSCYAALPNKNTTRLDQFVTGYYHCFLMKPSSDYAHIADGFLINIRHPVDRVLSWFWYVHPSNCLPPPSPRNTPNCEASRLLSKYYASFQRQTTPRTPEWFVATFFQKCFPDPERWAYWATINDNKMKRKENMQDQNQSLNNYNYQNDPHNCSTLARRSLSGNLDRTKIPLAAHLIANYREYTATTIFLHPNKPVWVVRIDHLWNDMKRIDRMLGGNGDFGTAMGSRYTHGSENFRNNINHPISSTTITQFCCALSAELLVYKHIIFRAANLEQSEMIKTWNTAMSRCGFDTWEELTKQCHIYG